VRRANSLAVLVCAGLMFAGCGKQGLQDAGKAAPLHPPMKPAPATPLAEEKTDLGTRTWDPSWDQIIEEALPSEMLSAQAARAVRSECPRFARMPEADKRAFWAYTFQAMAAAEAGLNPEADVHHTDPAVNRKDSVSGRVVRQQGLLQLTYEDSKRYGCDFNWKHDISLPAKDPGRTILQPKNNLGCGIRIMQNQIILRGKPLLVRTSYWSTLQPGTASYRVFAKQMANVPPSCGFGAARTKKAARARH